jgi:hypothetical protein
MFGIANGDSDRGYADIDYAFYTYPPTGLLTVYEKGTSKASLGAYAAGDKLRISIWSGGLVSYWLNGALAYTSAQPPVFPLRVDTSFNNIGAIVQDAVLAGNLIDDVSRVMLFFGGD